MFKTFVSLLSGHASYIQTTLSLPKLVLSKTHVYQSIKDKRHSHINTHLKSIVLSKDLGSSYKIL
jgi:hypothetical protein